MRRAMAESGTRSGPHGERCPVARKEAALWGREGPRGPSCFSESPRRSRPADPIAKAFFPREACPMTIRLAADANFIIIETS